MGWGWLELGERSMLKSPRSTRDMSLEGGSCSNAASTSVSKEASADGGRYRRPHTTLDRHRESSMMTSSALSWNRMVSK